MKKAPQVKGNASKATLPNGEKLSDKIKQNKANQNAQHQGKQQGKGASGDGSDKGANKKKKGAGQENKGKTSTGLPNVQGMGTEVAKEALKQAAGVVPYTKWIPKGIRDKIIDKFMDSDAGQALVEKGFKQIKLQLIFILITTVASALLTLFIIAATLTLILAPIAWIGDLLNGIGAFFEKLGNWFSGDGWCVASECQQNEQSRYYEELNKAIANYQGSCKINEDLITATIFYGQMVKEDNDSGTDEDNINKSYFDYLNVDGRGGNATSKINGLIKVYLKGEEITDEDTVDESGFVEVSECSSSAIKYREYLINNYIGNNYPDAAREGVRTKAEIANEILKMGGILNNGTLTIVENTDGLFTMLPDGLNLRVTSQPANCRCHPTKKVYQAHKGVDIGGAGYDTQILAFEDGVVEAVTTATTVTCGSSIIKLKHTTASGAVYYTRYVHLNRRSNNLLSTLPVGTNVSKGQVIGYVGGTTAEDSCSTGPHLHFEVHNGDGKVINPLVALNNYANGIDILANQEFIEVCAINGGSC